MLPHEYLDRGCTIRGETGDIVWGLPPLRQLERVALYLSQNLI